MDNKQLQDMRRDYASRSLLESSIASDPVAQFSTWMDEAINSEVIDANAMTVSTVDEMGRPSSRVVLLKGFDHDGFIFFTNYLSNKTADLDSNPNIALHFFWPDLQRQVALNGTAAKTSREVSEAYFATRPVESQIGAWASKQSSVLSDRQELEDSVAETRARFAGQTIPCPPFWGGFCVTPRRFEFWQGGTNRLHDRICYTLESETWRILRLSP
ncbi:MAG: pyridoxamine 5'-phosphate oxidase [Acidobacteriota bacterium]